MEDHGSKLEELLGASLNGASEGRQPVKAEPPTASRARGKRKADVARRNGRATDVDSKGSVGPDGAPPPAIKDTSPVLEFCMAEPMTLRQKLGEVRRRIGYVQKRGYNERHNYNYVTAADIAGAVGDILAELGVVVIPRLENITYEPHTSGRPDATRVARVIMAYTFTDADSGEEITARVAGEGLDVGDKAPYKAMTGALKYALLQSFLLATGDDPEDERADSRSASASERLVTPKQARDLQALIEETGTDVERVLAYYKASALGDLSETSYRRALELLNRKLVKRNQGSGAHAQD